MCSGASYTDKHFAFNSSSGYILASGFIFLFILCFSVLWHSFLDGVFLLLALENGLG